MTVFTYNGLLNTLTWTLKHDTSVTVGNLTKALNPRWALLDMEEAPNLGFLNLYNSDQYIVLLYSFVEWYLSELYFAGDYFGITAPLLSFNWLYRTPNGCWTKEKGYIVEKMKSNCLSNSSPDWFQSYCPRCRGGSRGGEMGELIRYQL